MTSCWPMGLPVCWLPVSMMDFQNPKKCETMLSACWTVKQQMTQRHRQAYRRSSARPYTRGRRLGIGLHQHLHDRQGGGATLDPNCEQAVDE